MKENEIEDKDDDKRKSLKAGNEEERNEDDKSKSQENKK